ncbi:MAG: Cas10/Cmr2 second palm domain-containing protein, partial [Bryobacteraceae bacterium]
MSVQLLLVGQLTGTEDFLLSPPGAAECAAGGDGLQYSLAGRSHWVSLLTEVLPRALLAELGLPRILLGASGGGQFLLVLPSEAGEPARQFLRQAADSVARLSGGRLRLLWGATENLGDWSVVRRRIQEEFERQWGEARALERSAFEPFDEPEVPVGDGYFPALGRALWEAEKVGWNPEEPARIVAGEGKHCWPLAQGRHPEAVVFARHMAPSDDGQAPADLATLARRAQGKPLWGVLRGDADNFRIRMRRAQTIEEHVQLSILYRQFFAGELEVLCSQPEFWRKVTILYTAADDFAVYGSWDALAPLAREMQRLFHRFCEENLKEFPGPEGKTISMAIALAEKPEATLPAVYAEAGRLLGLAKAADKDCLYFLGRTLEWKQLADAADLKDTLVRMVSDTAASRHVLHELSRFYHKKASGNRSEAELLEKPWRFQRRLNRALA